jgi:hypothetical protein
MRVVEAATVRLIKPKARKSKVPVLIAAE